MDVNFFLFHWDWNSSRPSEKWRINIFVEWIEFSGNEIATTARGTIYVHHVPRIVSSNNTSHKFQLFMVDLAIPRMHLLIFVFIWTLKQVVKFMPYNLDDHLCSYYLICFCSTIILKTRRVSGQNYHWDIYIYENQLIYCIFYESYAHERLTVGIFAEHISFAKKK